MSSTKLSVSVIAEASTYLRARDVVNATHLAIGPNVPITLRTSQTLVDDFTASQTQWPDVDIVAPDFPPAEILRNLTSDYVLVCPPLHVTGLTGILGACSLLDSDPQLSQVGGLVHLPGGHFWSGALCEIGDSHKGTIATAMLEDIRPHWSAQEQFAVTPADYLGAITVVRRENLREHHVIGDNVFARALVQGSPAKSGSAVVFSGLTATSSIRPEEIFPDPESGVKLPSQADANWSELGLRQITVLHRGYALRDDSRKEIFFHADNRIAAVDGRGDVLPSDPWDYYSSFRTRLQLGPGFRTLCAAIHPEGMSGSGGNFGGTVQGLTPAERSALKLMRTLAGKLPPRLLTTAQKIISRLGEKIR